MSLEQRLRDEAAHMARTVASPELDRLRGRAARHRALRVVTPVVLGVLVVATALSFGRSAESQRQPEPVAAAKPRPIPAGMQAVDYHGVEVLVPASWKLEDFGPCGPHPQSNTVHVHRPGDDGSFLACGRTSPPEASLYVVRMTMTDEPEPSHRPNAAQRSLSVDGHPALESLLRPRYGPVQHLIRIPDRQVEVSIEGPDPARVRQLIDDIRVIDVDQQGCATRANLTPTGQLLTEQPTGAVLCSYDRGWSESSKILDADEAQALVRALEQVPTGFSLDKSSRQSRQTTCALERQRGLLLRVNYGNQLQITLVARLAGCGNLGVSDDRSSRRIDTGLAISLKALIRYPGAAFFGMPHLIEG